MDDRCRFDRGPASYPRHRAPSQQRLGDRSGFVRVGPCDLVLREDITGATVAVQLHGLTDPTQLRRLAEAGATVLPVAPYRWTVHEDVARVHRLISTIEGRGIDAITFTSAPAADALFSIADSDGRLDTLQAALREEVVVAAVGPVTAAPLVKAGILPIVPDRFRMGALIRLLCEHLENSGAIRLETEFGELELRGRQVRLGELRTLLTPVGLALFRTLVRAGGSTVSRRDLAAAVPEPLDEHGVDVAVSRLRRALPEPALLQTVIKRGYRVPVL